MKLEKHLSLDELIDREKRAVAKDLFEEAWQQAVEESIDPAILAECFIESALENLIADGKQSSASDLIAYFKTMEELGLLARANSVH